MRSTAVIEGLRVAACLMMGVTLASGCGDDADREVTRDEVDAIGDGSPAADGLDGAEDPGAVAEGDAGRDAGAGGDRDGGFAGEIDYTGIVAQVVMHYDRQMNAYCTCAVPTGAFESEAECLANVGSGPDWVECAATALEEANLATASSEADALCMVEEADVRASCVEDSECDLDAIGACQSMGSSCAPLDFEVLAVLFEACPDLGLLSRASGPGG